VPSFIVAVRNRPASPTIENAIIKGGVFAPSESSIFDYVLRDGCKRRNALGQPPLVVDVGANLGWFTLLAASYGCRVISFEILPKAVQLIRLSLELNHFTDRVQLYHLGMSHISGNLTVYYNDNDWGFSSLRPLVGVPDGEVEQKVLVPVSTLDLMVKEDVILLKIDVEGAEDLVLEGGMQLIRNFNVENMIIETKLYRGDRMSKIAFINEMRRKYTVVYYEEIYLPGR